MCSSDYHIFHAEGRRFVFHGPSCLIFDISSSVYDCLEDPSSPGEKEEAVKHLDGCVAKNKRKVEYVTKGFEMKPSCLVLNISGKCNLACRYCFSQDKNGFKFKSMTVQECIDAVDFLVKANPDEEGYTIGVFGGEPLLEKETLMQVVPLILSTFKGKKFGFTITTNGTAFDDELVTFIKQYNISLLLSFDGLEEVVDTYRPHKTAGVSTFAQVLTCAEKLKRAEVPFSFRATIVASEGKLMDTIRFFESQETPYYLVPCFNSGNDNPTDFSDWGDEEILESFSKEYDEAVAYFLAKIENGETIYCYSFISKIKLISEQFFSRYSCGAGVSLLSAADKGRIFSCMNFATHPETEIGTVSGGVNEERRRKYLPFDVENKEECKDCLIRYQCCGGCVSERYDRKTGLINAPERSSCKLKLMMWKKEVAAYQSIKIKHPDFLENLPETQIVE